MTIVHTLKTLMKSLVKIEISLYKKGKNELEVICSIEENGFKIKFDGKFQVSIGKII